MKGHIRQRGPNRWAVIHELPPGPDGKRRQKWETVHGPKKAAQIRLREILTALDAGTYSEPAKTTVAGYLNDWVAGLTVAEKTRLRYEEIVRLHLVPTIGHIALQRLSAAHIEKLYRERRESGRADGRAGGLSERSLHHIHRVLGTAMKKAVRLRLISRNPCEDVDSPRPQRKEVAALSESDTGVLLEGAKGNPLYPLILVAVTTGLRLGELLGLKWSDVDLKKGALIVRRTLARVKQGAVLKDTPKTKHSIRTVALPPLTVETLHAHHAEQRREMMRLRLVWQDHELVFPAEDGSPCPPPRVSVQFTRLARSLGLGITFHGLRHTHATHLLRAGIHPKIASGRLGHANIGITMDTYSHLLGDDQQEAAARIDGMIRTVLK